MHLGQASLEGAYLAKFLLILTTPNWNAVAFIKNPDELSSLNEHKESLPYLYAGASGKASVRQDMVQPFTGCKKNPNQTKNCISKGKSMLKS